MSNMFGNLTTDGVEEAQDRLGGFRVLESGAYTVTIKAAYAGKSANSAAQSVTIIADTEEGVEYRETFWVTNKKGENFYVDNDKKKQPLAGFTYIDDICLVTTNKGLPQMATEDKVMNVYDPEAKKEVPKSVPMLVELLGKKCTLGIVKELVNKQTKNSNGDYEDTADTRETNATNKVFHFPSNLTTVEARKNIQTPTFYGAWVERNKEQTRDRRSIKDGASAQGGRSGRPAGTPPKAGESAAKTTSLFGA